MLCLKTTFKCSCSLPLWEGDASLTLLFSFQCSFWCRSQREVSQSCRHDLWYVSLSSAPVGSLKHQGSSLPPKMWSSDTGPTESNRGNKQKKKMWAGSWKQLDHLCHASVREMSNAGSRYILLHCNYFWLTLMVMLSLKHMHTLEGSHLLCLHQSYPFGDEVSAHHQVILGNPSVAWENWKKPAPREGRTKTVIQQNYTLNHYKVSILDYWTKRSNTLRRIMNKLINTHVNTYNKGDP